MTRAQPKKMTPEAIVHDLTPSKSEKTNCKILISIMGILLGSLVFYFAYYSISPVFENKETLVRENGIINDSGITTISDAIGKNSNDNAHELYGKGTVTNAISGEVTTVTTINMEENYTKNNSENIHGITMEGTVTPVTSIATPRRPITVTSLSSLEINKQETSPDGCLKHLLNRFKEIAGDTDKCSVEDIGKRSKITFLESTTPLFGCLNSDDENCDEKFHTAKKLYMYHGFNHIYYNFVMGNKGNLFEGRPLTCRAGETGSGLDLDDTIIIGTPFCVTFDQNNPFRFNNISNKLINCLENEGILSDNFTIEFNLDCKPYLGDTSDFLRYYNNRIKYVYL